MKNKRNWEKIYEEYKSPAKLTRFMHLKYKLQDNSVEKDGSMHMTKEEYDEYKKMKKIRENLPKIDNLKKYMDRLETDFSKLKNEYNLREQQGKDKQREQFLEKDVSENMKKQEEFIAKRKEINKKIAESKTPEEKEKLEAEKDGIDKELSELKSKIDSNNKEFTELKGKEGQYNFDKTLKDYSMEDLKYNCQQIRTTISKCNLVANNLMKGLSRDSIQPKLEGWKDRNLTSKKPLPIKQQDPVEADKGRQGLAQLVGKANPNQQNIENDDSQSLTQIVQNAYNKLPAKHYTFEEAFPRLAKIFPKLAETRVGKKMLEIKQKRHNKKVQTKEENNQPIDKIQPDDNSSTNNKVENDKKKEFRSYIKYDVLDVADRGYEAIRQEDLEKRRVEMRAKAKVKSAEMKKQQMQAQNKDEDAR